MHYGSMSSVFDILPRLHSLLALMLAKATDPQLCDTKLVRLTRTIVRLTRLIIREEAAAAHHKIKTAMLADPTWRARVIWELGGVEALHIWRQRFLFKFEDKVEPHNDGAFDVQASAADNDAQKADNPFHTLDQKPKYRFRLKQPERPFYGRRPADADASREYEPKPATSLMDMPIPLVPYDFWPPQLETKSATKSATKNAVPNTGGSDEAATNKGKSPPPKSETSKPP